MSKTLELLALPQAQAITKMLTDSLKPGVSLDQLTVHPGTILPDGSVRVLVDVKPESYEIPGWPYQDRASFTYLRVDLADLFAGIDLRLTVEPDVTTRRLRTSMGVLVGQLESIFGISFEDDDFLEETIDGIGPLDLVLRAAPTSLRYSGQVSLRLYPKPAAGEDTDEVILTLSHLDLLTLPVLDLTTLKVQNTFTANPSAL